MKATHSCLILAIFSVLACASSLWGQKAAAKVAVPAEAAQAEATKLFKEVYGDEYAKAKTTADKQALAQKLLAKANESKKDPPSQFVVLRLARGHRFAGRRWADGVSGDRCNQRRVSG